MSKFGNNKQMKTGQNTTPPVVKSSQPTQPTQGAQQNDTSSSDIKVECSPVDVASMKHDQLKKLCEAASELACRTNASVHSSVRVAKVSIGEFWVIRYVATLTSGNQTETVVLG